MSNIWATFARKIVANNVQKSPNLLTLNGSFMSLLFSYKQNDDDVIGNKFKTSCERVQFRMETDTSKNSLVERSFKF